jgi:hypothetical protein
VGFAVPLREMPLFVPVLQGVGAELLVRGFAAVVATAVKSAALLSVSVQGFVRIATLVVVVAGEGPEPSKHAAVEP